MRVPAAWCGLYSLKPSIARTPTGGMHMWFHPGMDYILAIIGPLARSLDDLELFCRVRDLAPLRGFKQQGGCFDSNNWY